MKETTIFERELVSAVKGRLKCRIMNPDGMVREFPWQRNMITDAGLDKIAYMPWASTFQWSVAGTGTTPTKVDTGSTASQSSSTVTIQSGTFQFTPGHVGKLIYWPTPNVEARITGFSTSQTVTVSVSQSVATDTFVIYNVDQTALVTPYSQNMRYQTGVGYCGTVFSGNTIRLLRTFDYYMELSPVLITEIGFKEGPAATTLFSRILLTEPLYLSPGQWLQVSYELTLRLEPQSLTSKTPTIVGWPISPATDTAGNEQIQLYGIAQVDNQGITRPVDLGLLANEPFAPGTRLLGPGYGYINRWQNGAGSPIKIYSHFGENPFINPREMAAKYAASSSKSYIPNGATGNAQWFNSTFPAVLSNARTDCMQPLLPPPGYPNSGANDWNGTDPYTNFPSPVPNYGQTSWDNWKDEVSPNTVNPASIQLTANGTNLPGATYQWSAWNGSTFVAISGANGTVLNVQPSDIVSTSQQFQVVVNADGTTVGLQDQITVYINDDITTPPNYAISIQNETPIAHVSSASAGNMILDAADVGISGRAAIPIKVFRNLAGLTHTAASPGAGQFRVTINVSASVLLVDPTTGTIYFPSTNPGLGQALTTLTVQITVNTEGQSSSVITVPIRFFSDHINYAWITPSDTIFRRGTGRVDVGGSSVFISENGSVQAAVGSTIDRSTPRNVEIPLVLEPYTTKTFTRVKKATFLTNMANGSNWRTIGIGGTDFDITVANRTNAAKYNSYAFVFNQAQTKLFTHELSVFFRYTWRRDFT